MSSQRIFIASTLRGSPTPILLTTGRTGRRGVFCLAPSKTLISRSSANHGLRSQWQTIAGSVCKPGTQQQRSSLSTSTTTRRTSPNAKKKTSNANTNTPPRRRSYRPLTLFFIFTFASASVFYYLASTPSPPRNQILSRDVFTPFELVSRDQVSPTSFVLTLRPSPSDFPSLTSSDIASQLADPWRTFDLWSVEVKQPQLQIAREYTPLPPLSSAPDHAAVVRLLVRAVDGGEVSTYLSRLPVGSRVELRGPHGGFDLHSRLGLYGKEEIDGVSAAGGEEPQREQGGKQVVFLAGGTGIATALQAAHSVLEDDDDDDDDDAKPNVKILWAMRSRSDMQDLSASTGGKSSSGSRPWWRSFLSGSFASDDEAEEIRGPDFAAPTSITAQLLSMKARHGDRVRVHSVVDDEGTAITPKDLLGALRHGSGASKGTAPAPAPAAAVSLSKTSTSTSTPPPPCEFHSQPLQANMPDGAPNQGRKDLASREACRCPPEDAPGKNLLLVSGPDGFIAAYVGPRPWEGGAQVQGTVGGVLGELERRDPGLLKDWIVLKM
ncbi:hypothetical protein SODALDRAFT_332543 [Sodiomyces alkalinus F11]|uniref:FAD-binding FR-type domain-containing protein n=1 Tax=Sodiomyces alkalinus (strain CBS 110278 / VKM F-3762 / F11) TaxID=1314773 RepID=A0A3N2PX78_SODAK|nr:hypothetical protein SODALDRAFT_332543 [Sodiomyces alkalinus F11]ROT39121.1 hypothetical protein SODALDRAFT_332543 [Sodiomyces alkalinus F11]